MKQRISVEQLQELTEEQKGRLREWWRPRKGDWYYYLNIQYSHVITDSSEYALSSYNNHKRDYLPLLSIGQCIELLKDKAPENVVCELMVRLFSGGWIFADENQVLVPTCRKPVELVDALWEQIKAVL